MSKSSQEDKTLSCSLNKSRLEGYERPYFYHNSKSPKNKNHQFSATNPTSKVLGDVKINIQPFSKTRTKNLNNDESIKKNDSNNESDEKENLENNEITNATETTTTNDQSPR